MSAVDSMLNQHHTYVLKKHCAESEHISHDWKVAVPS